MDMSVFDLFKIGIGPSSSHTVGPMVAARRFLIECGPLEDAVGVEAHLYGSLALTGKGHATDVAVLLGLAGWEPETVDPDEAPAIVAGIRESGRLPLDGAADLPFDAARDLVLDPAFLPEHPNGMVFEAVLADGDRLTRRYASIGGGAIVEVGAPARQTNVALRHDFTSAAELLALGRVANLSIAEIVVIRSNDRAISPARVRPPPTRPVRPPWAITAMPRALHRRRMAATSAVVAFLIVSLLLRRAAPVPDDETTERIQALIDEANRLIKALDEKRHA